MKNGYCLANVSIFKIRECCFIVIHLYSNSLSVLATISLSIVLEIFPACFSCSFNSNISESSSGLEDKNLVDGETPEAETFIAGHSSNLRGV